MGKHRSADWWEAQDWTLSSPALAGHIGASPSTVRAWRRRLGKPPAPEVRSRYDWASVDWSQPNTAIAERLGCTRTTVADARRRIRPRKDGSPRSEYDWDGVDWGMSNAQIARALGCDRWTVRDRRRRTGARAAPQSPDHRTVEALYDFASVGDAIGLVPDAQIAERLGCSVSSVKTYRSRKGIAAEWHRADPAKSSAYPDPPRWRPRPTPALRHVPTAVMAYYLDVDTPTIVGYRISTGVDNTRVRPQCYCGEASMAAFTLGPSDRCDPCVRARRRRARERFKAKPEVVVRDRIRRRVREALNGSRSHGGVSALEGIDTRALAHALGPRPKGATIGHVVPMRCFDLTCPEQRALCFSPVNIRWEPPGENFARADRLPSGRLARFVGSDDAEVVDLVAGVRRAHSEWRNKPQQFQILTPPP